MSIHCSQPNGPLKPLLKTYALRIYNAAEKTAQSRREMEKINIAEMRKETLIFDTRPVTMQRKRKRIMGRHVSRR